MDKQLIDILACPSCKAGVGLNDGNIVCTGCGRIYQCREDIPIMMAKVAHEESTAFSLVIPTYNEAANIEKICRRISNLLSVQKKDFEIIIVDDDSPDLTWKIAEKLAQEEKHIKVIHRQGKRGLSSAVVAGWKAARGQILGVIDGDLQHPPEKLPEMIEVMAKDPVADIVVASRNIAGGGISKWSILRKLVSGTGKLVSELFLSDKLANVKDPMSGYFILRKDVINDIRLSPIGYKILLEVLVKGNYRKIVEVPFIFQERTLGGSKAGLIQYATSLFHIMRLSVESIGILGAAYMFIRRIINTLISAISRMFGFKRQKFPTEAEEGYYHKALEKRLVQSYWHRKKFASAYEKLGPSPVLDIGAGSGVFLHLYNETRGVNINLDCSYAQLSYGKNINPKAYYVNAMATELPFVSGSIGTVYMIEVIEHLKKEDIAKTLSEVLRVLKVGGKLVISTPNYRSLWPLLEMAVSAFGPIDYRIQHITHFTINRLAGHIEASGLKIKRKETFFVLSFLFSVISERLADLLFRIEKRLFPRSGALIIMEAVKT